MTPPQLHRIIDRLTPGTDEYWAEIALLAKPTEAPPQFLARYGLPPMVPVAPDMGWGRRD